MAPSFLTPVAAALALPHDEAVPNVLTDDDLKILLPLDLTKAESAPSLCSLGLLGNLPPELIIAILDQLSLLSLIRFRNASRHARFFVDSMPMFRTIMDHAPQAIRGILAVQTKIGITLPQLFNKLRQRHCDHCGGGLAQRLWLPTVSRLCIACGQLRPRPLKGEELIERYGLTSLDLASIPSFYFLPARFANENNYFQIQVRHTLYDTYVAGKLVYERTGRTVRPPGLLCKARGKCTSSLVVLRNLSP